MDKETVCYPMALAAVRSMAVVLLLVIQSLLLLPFFVVFLAGCHVLYLMSFLEL